MFRPTFALLGLSLLAGGACAQPSAGPLHPPIEPLARGVEWVAGQQDGVR